MCDIRNVGSKQAYDAHMNLILSEVEETISSVEIGQDGGVLGVKVSLCFPSQTFLNDKLFRFFTNMDDPCMCG